ncbi:hypothetical protein [Thermus caldilimi]|uniref:hypothetical protein n=1 Tax=Thermus caldilimi TaxID=2483360 RepID=UPI0010767B36|nr:hypothetical protein [Thermus caldilimi]
MIRKEGMMRKVVATLAVFVAVGVPALRAWRGELPFPNVEAAWVFVLLMVAAVAMAATERR